MKPSIRMMIAIAALAASLALAPAVAAQEKPQDPHFLAALDLRAQALVAYQSGDYDTAAELARKAKAELALVAKALPPAPQPEPEPEPEPAPAVAELPPLPASYTVRLVIEDRDCLSKIAGFPFVYGDRNKWAILYKANRKTLAHPENADLILPGEVLLIPSIAGEIREGEWSADKEYPKFE